MMNFDSNAFETEIRFHISNAMFSKNYKEIDMQKVLETYLDQDKDIRKKYTDLQASKFSKEE
jgi:hypothetical protein